MFANSVLTTHRHLLLPSLAVVLVYVALDAIPQHRELRQVRTETRSHAVAVEQLARRVRAQPRPPESEGVDPEGVELIGPAGFLPETRSSANFASPWAHEQTFIQTFAQVLEVFQTQAVCTAAGPDKDAPAGQASEAAVQRVSLIGPFANVLTALETIEAESPHAWVVAFSMQRPDPAEPCRWEFTLRFKEMAR